MATRTRSRKPRSFFDLLTEAINYFAEHGYTNRAELEAWVRRLRQAAVGYLPSNTSMETDIRRALTRSYTHLVTRGGLKSANPAVSAFTIDRLKPAMKAELNRRIAASADLIKLNRQAAIDDTLRRFQGWATSVPAGGSDVVKRTEEKANVRKPLAKMDFIARRCITDQTHKFAASVNAIVAESGGAIAAIWHSPWRRPGYDYRKDHKERDEHVYLIRDSWAHKAGLVKPGDAGYTDQITAPGEEVYCSCKYQYVYGLDRLPNDMLTAAGRQKLALAKN